MRTMNISLPDEMREYVDRQISLEGYSTASEYIRNLIRADQKRSARQEIENRLLDALQTDAKELSEQDWLDIRSEAISIIQNKLAKR